MTSNHSTDLPRRKPSLVVFWMLILMGFMGLAPCVLLPEWREYQALRYIEQREQYELDDLRGTVARQERELEALQTDAGAVARLARRDLRFHRPGETVVGLRVFNPPPIESVPFIFRPDSPPAPIAKYAAYLPNFDYEAVFCDGKTRGLVTAMSLGLILTALLMYRP